MNKPRLSIIIPALHEAKRIGETLDKLAKYITEHKLGQVEIIVVVADDIDGTAKVAAAHAQQFENLRIVELIKKVGKGRDVKHGMLAATGEYRIFMDADLATPLHHLETVDKFIRQNQPVIIGVRDLKQSHTGIRMFISEFGNILTRVLLGIKITDTQCGFKAFRQDVAIDLFENLTIYGWGFDMELLAIATKRGHQISTILIDDWEDIVGGSFANVAITGAISTFTELVRIKWNLICGQYR